MNSILCYTGTEIKLWRIKYKCISHSHRSDQLSITISIIDLNGLYAFSQIIITSIYFPVLPQKYCLMNYVDSQKVNKIHRFKYILQYIIAIVSVPLWFYFVWICFVSCSRLFYVPFQILNAIIIALKLGKNLILIVDWAGCN